MNKREKIVCVVIGALIMALLLFIKPKLSYTNIDPTSPKKKVLLDEPEVSIVSKYSINEKGITVYILETQENKSHYLVIVRGDYVDVVFLEDVPDNVRLE